MTVYGAELEMADKYDDQAREYDAILFMSFGGPEGMDEVIPFLERVTEGRNVPRERLEEVAEHYYHFDGVSPINRQNREIIGALEKELKVHDINLPIYFGNRNSEPFVTDAIRQMRDDGVERAVAFVTSGFSCWSGCRQYREDIIRALEEVDGEVPVIDKIRVFYNHPQFIEASVERIKEKVENFNAELNDIHLIFTAHSIPMGMANNSDYEVQLEESCRLIAKELGTQNYALTYQSRSGPPFIPWLEPDILDYMTEAADDGIDKMLIYPIGFISDHMEVKFDLDEEAKELAEELQVQMERSRTVETHPAFISMIRDLIQERMTDNPERACLGNRPPNHDICPVDCCLQGKKPTRGRP